MSAHENLEEFKRPIANEILLAIRNRNLKTAHDVHKYTGYEINKRCLEKLSSGEYETWSIKRLLALAKLLKCDISINVKAPPAVMRSI